MATRYEPPVWPRRTKNLRRPVVEAPLTGPRRMPMALPGTGQCGWVRWNSTGDSGVIESSSATFDSAATS